MKHQMQGFTLVELVVVLAILIALATVAVSSLEGVQDQTRYSATQQGLQNIEDAVLGPANQLSPQGVPLVTGFVADIGRVPVATLINGISQPQELWDNPNNLNPFGVYPAAIANIPGGTAGLAPAGDEDPAVFVACGWRGPYLRLGIGQTTLTDGWGNPYDLLDPTRTVVIPPGQINIVRSLGVDYIVNSSPTNNYNEDIYLNFNTNQFNGTTAINDYPAVSARDRYHASPLQVTVQNGNGSPLGSPPSALPLTVTLKYFGPDPLTGKIKVITAQTIITSTTPSLVFTLTNASITIGPRILRAYMATTPTTASAVTPIILFPSGNTAVVNF